MEQEIETVLVLTKKLKLRAASGQLIAGYIKVFECETPYVIVILVDTEYGQSVRMDVHKEDLASELRHWLEGKQIRNPAVLIPMRIEDSINRFVKFGKTPLQEDLIMWMLSRSELYLTSDPFLVFGGQSVDAALEERVYDATYTNEYSKNAMAAVKGDYQSEQQYRIEGAVGRGTKLEFSLPSKSKTASSDFPATNAHKTISRSEDQGMFAMTRKLLGKSATMEMLKQKKLKGREGARQTIAPATWNSGNLELVTSVQMARKNIEAAMDERRRMIEIAKIRQVQAAEKFRKIRDELAGNVAGNKFVVTATHELLSLQKMEADILEDIKRQKNRAQRAAQKVTWTMAPSGFVNRRGKSQRGPVLGQGPLHPNATSALKDPRVEKTVRQFYWDSAGRRHPKDGVDDADKESLVEKALEAIRRAAANISAFKLDLKQVFEEFDTSGDGFLSPPEMAQAFISMGVQLDVESMNAIFKHFDPNDSGTVHYGEFVWAFFNRRSLVRQWKRKTDGMTEAAIKTKFHLADVNGDGRLNPKEFKKLLKTFGMEIAPADVEILIERFDVDNDGDIDLHEFRAFIESEQKNLFETSAAVASKSALLPPPKSTSYRSGAREGGYTDDSGIGMARPRTAGASRASQSVNSSRELPPRRPASAPRSRLNATAPGVIESSPNRRYGTGSLDRSVGFDVDEEPSGPEKIIHKTYPRQGDHRQLRTIEETTGEFTDTLGSDRVGMTVAEMPAMARSSGAAGSALEEDVDVLWVARMLQAQAEVESRIGKRYYS